MSLVLADGVAQRVWDYDDVFRRIDDYEIDNALGVIESAVSRVGGGGTQDLVLHLNDLLPDSPSGPAQHPLLTPDVFQHAKDILSNAELQRVVLQMTEVRNMVDRMMLPTASIASPPQLLRTDADNGLSGSYVDVATDLSTAAAPQSTGGRGHQLSTQQQPQAQPRDSSATAATGNTAAAAGRVRIRAAGVNECVLPIFQVPGDELGSGRGAAAPAGVPPQEAVFQQSLSEYACRLCGETVVAAHNCSCRCNSVFCGECLLNSLQGQLEQHGPAALSCPHCRAPVDSPNGFPIIDCAVGHFVGAAPQCASKARWYARGERWKHLQALSWPQQVKAHLQASYDGCDDADCACASLCSSDSAWERAEEEGELPLSSINSSPAAAAAVGSVAGGQPADDVGAGAAAPGPDWWNALPEYARTHSTTVFKLAALVIAVVVSTRMRRG